MVVETMPRLDTVLCSFSWTRWGGDAPGTKGEPAEGGGAPGSKGWPAEGRGGGAPGTKGGPAEGGRPRD